MDYIVSLYNNGKYQGQIGPCTLEEALKYAHAYDGFKHRQAIVWDINTEEDLYKSSLAND